MLIKFKKHIQTNFPSLKDQKLLLAISGGIDSMVLLHLFHELDFDISIAHCNFMLRDEASNKDEDFVRAAWVADRKGKASGYSRSSIA